MSTNSEPEKILIGLTVTKEADFSDWYRQVILKSELIDYTDISGCYVLRPNSYAIWEEIQTYVNSEIKKMGVKNAYFPLFISKSALETERSHIEGFEPEVAWITKSGSSILAEPLAVRPTSETSMYPLFSNWVKTHRDLPLKINQWCNVVRWEMKSCMPFIRSREFLWQEGHTCFQTKTDADAEIQQILNMYADVYENLLAVPVIQGRKSEREKFAGADYTTTVECFIPTVGKAVQGATAHCLGQNFSKMFNISIENPDQTKHFVYQNSWGLTTRSIGVMIMVNSDNKGLILPPKIAPIKVVIIPCGINSKTTTEQLELINKTCQQIHMLLNDFNIPTHIDDRDNYRVGYKFNFWEMRGIPIRIEVGLTDIKNHTVCVCRRDTGEKVNIACDISSEFIEVTNKAGGKQTIQYSSDLVAKSQVDRVERSNKTMTFYESIKDLLQQIQTNMFTKARIERDAHIIYCNDINKFINAIQKKDMCLLPWCEEIKCEEEIIGFSKKSDLTVKSLCIPFDQELAIRASGNKECTIKDDTKCFYCGNKAKSFTLFGASY